MKLLKYLTLTLAAALALGGTVSAAPPVADVLKLPEWPVSSSSYGGKLIFSDSPELATADGILYMDKVEGDTRLFFHHVNATAENRRIAVLLENDGPLPAKVTVYQYGLGGPSEDWIAVGKAAQMAYLAGGDLYATEVPAKGAAPLYPALETMIAKPNMLVNGIFDFVADRPVTVKVMLLPVGADTAKFARQAPVLPPDEQRLRGTFDGKDRLLIPLKVYDPDKDGPVAITLGDNNLDRYLEGIDATNGSKVVNFGNYGVVYRLFLPGDGQRRLSYYLNPRGGDYAGGLGIKYQHKGVPPVATPAGRTAFGSDKLTDFAPLGSFVSSESLWLTFSPPGASNLPVKLVIVPESQGL
jgi:hypothetical protein